MDSDLSFLRAFPAASDYLSAMYLIQRDYGAITNLHLAQALNISTSAVSQAAGRLKKLGMVSQEKYGDLHLTQEGRHYAALILKRHYLIEHLLVRKVNYPWDKADAEALVLQNHISSDLAEHLDMVLGFPQTCPHGNPLPGSPCEAELLKAPRLAEVMPGAGGTQITILRITEEGEAIPAMLPFCQAHSIMPHTDFVLTLGNEGGRFLEPASGQTKGIQRAEDAASLSSPAGFFIPHELALHIGVRVGADRMSAS